MLECETEIFGAPDGQRTCGKPAKRVIDPYREEIYDEWVEIVICDEHLKDRIEDI